MNVAGTLTYDTKLNTDGIGNGASKIGSSAVAIGNLMANMVTKVAQSLVEVGKMSVEYNMQLETYQTALTTLTGSTEEANKIINQIKQDAAQTPFDVAGLTQANQLLISAGIDANTAREDILALGNAIAATGGGNDELSRMAVNLQQIKNVGQASALDIKQFAYAGIDVYGLLADSMEITREEASQLNVTYEDLTTALKKAANDGGRYANAMANQSKTLNGQISNLKDNFNSFIGEAAMPLFNFLKDDLLPIVNQMLDGAIGIDEGLLQLSDILLNGILSLTDIILEKLPEFLDLGIKLLLNIETGIAEKLPDLVTKMIECIVLLVVTILDNLQLFIDAAIEIVVALITGLIEPENLSKLISAAITLILALARGMIEAIPELLTVVPRIILSIFTKLKDIILETDWKQLGKDMLNGIIDGLTNFGSKIKDAAKKIYNEVKNKIKDFFGISSPSKKMRDEIGQWIPKGIAVGITANTDSAIESIDKMNDDIMDRMTQAVNIETNKMSFSGTNGNVNEILSANGTFTGTINNVLELDGEVVYENQQEITARKNLQYGGA